MHQPTLNAQVLLGATDCPPISVSSARPTPFLFARAGHVRPDGFPPVPSLLQLATRLLSGQQRHRCVIDEGPNLMRLGPSSRGSARGPLAHLGNRLGKGLGPDQDFSWSGPELVAGAGFEPTTSGLCASVTPISAAPSWQNSNRKSDHRESQSATHAHRRLRNRPTNNPAATLRHECHSPRTLPEARTGQSSSGFQVHTRPGR